MAKKQTRDTTRMREFDAVMARVLSSEFPGVWIAAKKDWEQMTPKEFARTLFATGANAYLRDVARKEGLLGHVRFGHEVQEAAWDDTAKHWRITTNAGTTVAKAMYAYKVARTPF